MAIKRKEVLTCVTTWRKLRNIIPSERKQAQKAAYFMISFTRKFQNRQVDGDKKSTVCYPGLGWGMRK